MATDQTIAVYAAEDLWAAKEFNAAIRFGDWNEIWPFYHKLATRLNESGIREGVKPPSVKPRKGATKAHYDATSATVFIPPFSIGGSWALNTATAIHEFAHHISSGDHGPEFRQAMLDCLNALGWEADLLARCYSETGVTSSTKGDKVIDLVTKILNKADRAGTPEERIAFLEGAERLASKHSLDLALMRKRQADASEDRDRPTTGKLYDLSPLPNVTARNLAVELGSAIGRAHGTECFIRGRSQYLTFMGYPEDIHMVELMLSRVLPMMFEDADDYLRSPEHRYSGVANVSARITFCKSYAGEVGRRLREAVKATQDEVAHETEGQGTAPVGSTEIALATKAVEVKDYVKYEFQRLGVRGHWSGSRTSNWSGSAHDSGRRAAREANLFGRKELT